MKTLFCVSSRRVALAAFVVVLALGGLIGAAPASAKAKGCGERVVNDWFVHKDGRVHGHYPLSCYREALDSLTPDIDSYTDARRAISEALAAERLRRGGSGDSSGPLLPGEKPIAHRSTYRPPIVAPPIQTNDKTTASTAGPSSVPVPLIVLAGLAILLLTAGGASYVARRVRGGRGGPPAA